MILTIAIASILSMSVLLAVFWCQILGFLNGWLREKLESIFGTENCEVYRNLIVWLDDKVCKEKRLILNAYKWLREKVICCIARYRKSDNGYVKETETVIANPATKGRYIRTVVEEEVPWDELPTSVREEMLRRNVNDAELDIMDVVGEKVKEKIAVMA